MGPFPLATYRSRLRLKYGKGNGLLVPAVPGVLLFVALFGAGRGTTSLTRPAVVVHMYGSNRFASVNGFLALVTAVSRALGPLTVGLVRDWFGACEPTLVILIGIGVTSAAALFMVREATD